MTANTFGLRLLAQQRFRFVVLALIAVLVLAFRALQFVGLTHEIQWGYDFSYYWTAALHLLHGEPIYSAAELAGPFSPQGQVGFLYPPPLAALVTPLAILFPTDYRAAAWIWTAIGAVVLVVGVLALWRSERLGDCFPALEGRRRWLLVAAAFAFPPVVGELVLGNVHLLLFGLLTLAWLGLRHGDSRGDMVGGIAIGIAAVVKVFPGLILLWLLLTRRYRAAAWFVAGAAIFAVVTLPITGFQPWQQLPTVLANLSAPSNTTDTLAPTVWLTPVFGFTAARVLVTLVGLAIVTWAAFVRPNPALGFALVATVSILIAPALYHHYLALLVLPFVLALGAGVPGRWLALPYFLMWGGQQPALGDVAFLLNRAAPTLGALVLLGLLAIAARRSATRTPDTLRANADARPTRPEQPDPGPAGIQRGRSNRAGA